MVHLKAAWWQILVKYWTETSQSNPIHAFSFSLTQETRPDYPKLGKIMFMEGLFPIR